MLAPLHHLQFILSDIVRPAFAAYVKEVLIPEITPDTAVTARARGRKDGRRFALSKSQVRLAQAAMATQDTSDRYVDPNGNLRDYGRRVLGA